MSSRDRGAKVIDALLRSRDDEAIKILKEKGDVDLDIENKGDYAIHLAARRGNINVIQAMKDKGGNLGQKNLAHNVPMHYAAKGGYIDLVRYLKENGAQLNTTNLDGECPLHEAVKTQTMDIIETLVDLGMDPNVRNKEGQTSLHIALKYGAVEAMEALLIKKAKPDITDNAGRKPKDVAKNSSIRESLQMHATMMSAMQSGNIKAKGMKIKRRDVSKPTKIDRVGIIIEAIDIPKEFPTGFYCRREKAENSTVAIPVHEEESVFSDVFHIRIFEVNRDCTTKISLPVYKAPSDKEQMVIRIINSGEEDTVIETYETKNKVNYCMLETTLIPETTCVCVIYVRSKKEDNKVSEEAALITSELEKDFSLDVPAGSFEGETTLSLTVFETSTDDYVESEDDFEEDESKSESNTATDNSKEKLSTDTESDKTNTVVDETQTSVKTDANETNDQEQTTDALKQPPENSAMSTKKSDLVTDVYQINIAGQQPKKGIRVQIPLCKGMNIEDEIAIVHADETDLENAGSIQILPIQPKIVGMNLVFEVTEFCIYVASWKKKVGTKEERIELQRQISMTRDKRKPAALFAVLKQVEGLRHIMVVECVVASKSNERRRRWHEKDGYEIQNPPEAGAIMMAPGDTFYVNVEGNAFLEDQTDSTERKLQFYQVRSSWQPYYVQLKENIYEEEKAVGYVVVSKKTDKGLEECARLRIKLTAPPPPPPPPSADPKVAELALVADKLKERLKPSEEEIETVVEDIEPVRPRPSTSSRWRKAAFSSRPKTAPPRPDRQAQQEMMALVVDRFRDKLKPSYKPETAIEDRLRNPLVKKSSKVAPVNLPFDVYGSGGRQSNLSDRSSRVSVSQQSNKSSSNASTKSGGSKATPRNLNVRPARK